MGVPPRISSGTISSTVGGGSMTQNEPAATTGDQETVALTRPPTALSGDLSPRSSGTVFESAEPPAAASGGEPPEDPPSAPKAAKPPRKRRGLLIGALAVVVVVALGATAVFTIEPVGRVFGIGPSAVPTEPAPDPIDPDFALIPVDHVSAGPTEAGLASALQPSVTAAEVGTLHAVIVDPGTGQSLWGNEADVPATPASTTKILTSAAALLTFPADHTFTTTVVAGPTPGSVILVGGGDPSLTAVPEGTDTLYASNPARISDLAAQVRENAGDIAITEVLVDASRYTGQAIADGWDASDAPSSYGGFIEPLMLDGGRSDPLNDLSQRVGDPALEAGNALAAELGATSVSAVDEAGSPADGEVLGEISSLPLVDLIEAMMLLSDNVAAEMLAREVAIERGAEPSFAGGAASIIEVLGENGFDISQLELSDASGLSNQNLITPNLLGDVLSLAAHPADESDTAVSQQLRPMLTGLAVAGASGKLTDRYPAGASAGRGWVRAKTGSLTAVNGLAGVVTDRDGKLMAFALLSSGTNATVARPALDEVTSALRECGCR